MSLSSPCQARWAARTDRGGEREQLQCSVIAASQSCRPARASPQSELPCAVGLRRDRGRGGRVRRLLLPQRRRPRLRSTSSQHCRGPRVQGEPVWWPLPWLPLAGLVVALTIRYLPGNAGHKPAEGFKTGGPCPPIELPGIVIASLATLCLGVVLGPEAPLIAIGSGIGVLAVHLVKRNAPAKAIAVIGAAGSFAAISTLLGSPLVGAFLLMEIAGLGGPDAGRRARAGPARRGRGLAHLRRTGRLDRLRDVLAGDPESSRLSGARTAPSSSGRSPSASLAAILGGGHPAVWPVPPADRRAADASR